MVRAAHQIRTEVVGLDLVIDFLNRADEGVSRATVVELMARLDRIGSTLSEVAASIEHVAP